MEVGHADAEGDGVGALRAEDVRVGPAAGGGVAGLKAASGRSGLQMRDDGVAGLVHDSRVVQLPGHFHLAAEASGGFFQGAGHGVALGKHAILVQRTALPHERHDGGHDVHGHAALDAADVGRGALVDAPKRHGGHGGCGDLNGGDALLRFHAGMGGTALDASAQRPVVGRAHDDGARRPVRIEHEQRETSVALGFRGSRRQILRPRERALGQGTGP